MFTRSVIFLIFTFGVVSVDAQMFPSVKEFVAPPYPPAARAVRATGVVQVAIQVDEKGRVVSAEAVAGHPLLRAAARTSAYKWTFSNIPGNHFLTLRFIFDLPTQTSKKAALLNGAYTLRLTEQVVKIVQTKSHQAVLR